MSQGPAPPGARGTGARSGGVCPPGGEAREEGAGGQEHADPDGAGAADRGAEGPPRGRVPLPAERGEEADPPVADLVEVALDDDRAVVGDRAGGGHLIAQVLEEI